MRKRKASTRTTTFRAYRRGLSRLPATVRPMSEAAADGPSWAKRLLPRSVLGIVALILAASLGAAFSGAVLYAYYEFRSDRSDSKAEQFAATFKKSVDNAVKTIDQERENAKQAVRDELAPLEQIAATGKTL